MLKVSRITPPKVAVIIPNADNRVKAMLKSNLCSDNRKNAQSYCVEEEKGTAEVTDFFSEHNGQHDRYENNVDIIQVSHPGDGVGVDQHIPQGPSAYCRDKGNDKNPESVHFFVDREQCPGNCKGGGSRQVPNIEYSHCLKD